MKKESNITGIRLNNQKALFLFLLSFRSLRTVSQVKATQVFMKDIYKYDVYELDQRLFNTEYLYSL
jgi:hypothetical protein